MALVIMSVAAEALCRYPFLLGPPRGRVSVLFALPRPLQDLDCAVEVFVQNLLDTSTTIYRSLAGPCICALKSVELLHITGR